MVIHTNVWSPDTCKCTIEFTWDDTVDPSLRTHNFSRYITKCADHSILADLSGNSCVIDENTRKNFARQLIIDNAPVSFVNIDASGNRSLPVGESISFTVSGTAPNRVFGMIFAGATLTSGQISNVQTKLDTRFGSGKVIFSNTP